MKKILFILFVLLIVSCASGPEVKGQKKSGEDSNISDKKVAKVDLNQESLKMEQKLPLKTGKLEVEYKVLHSGTNSKGGNSCVIRTQKELKAFYSDFYGELNPKMPEIKFETQAVVAVFGGQFNTGGYEVKLVSGVEVEDCLNLGFFITSPSSTDIVTQALTRPFLIVAVKVSKDKKINVFVDGENSNERISNKIRGAAE